MVQTSISAWLTKPKTSQQVPVSLGKSSTPKTTVPEPTASDAQTQIGNPANEDLSNITSVRKPSFTSKHHSTPPNATISSITAETLPAFRRMTSSILPVPYPDKFYSEILTDEVASSISLVCLWADTSRGDSRVVSGIRCRLLANSPAAVSNANATSNSPSLYLSTITTLAPYRGHGLASALLRRIIARAIHDYGITTVTAHMWEANEDAREWYAKHGFKEMKFEKEYYRRLRPAGAWILERTIGPQDLLGEADTVIGAVTVISEG